MLIQLPNGNWIDPRLVRAVVAFPRSDDMPGGAWPARVVVQAGESWEVIQCESEDDAERLRDELATTINAARAGG